ncbi:hypothetical protein B4U80_13794 [Leptotrombidium deliense]|uniref:Uncharacterized protein n=1 Tax=Leptotrombidium deliense TaxID=299467 RepID=A0A443SDU6_9ACAR|nr:hypothetical protein B4U80_13794 [Leptotrombidium deliense]
MTTIERLTNRLRQCRSVSKNGVANFALLPMLSKSVFKNIVSELKITLFQSTFEADNEIVVIANHFHCPVLSNDSDFFIFDIEAGFIPLKTLNFTCVKEVKAEKTEEGKQCFIDCNRYNINLLLQHFHGLDKSLLPLFSCLIGNDYTEHSNFQKMLNSLPNAESKLKTRKLRTVSKQEKKMIQLLDWMRYKTKSDIITFLLRFLKLTERETALQEINSILSVYGTVEKSTFFDNLTKGDTYQELSIRLKLPVWFLQNFNSGLIDSSSMNVASMNRLILMPQVEDFTLSSCYDCSVKLQKLYFQLSRNSQHQSQFVVFERNTSVISKKNVEVDVSDLCLHTLQLSSKKELLLLQALNICPESFKSTCNDLQSLIDNVNICVSSEELNCFMHLVDYWLRESIESNTCVYAEFVIALIASVVYNVCVHNKKRMRKSEEVSMNKYFQKYLSAFVPNNGNKFESRIVHFYNQLQAIIMFYFRINALLDNKLPYIRVERVFDGILLYNLTTELLSRPHPRDYITQKFNEVNKLSLLFQFMCDFVMKGKKIERKYSNLPKRKVKRSKKSINNVNETNSRFAALEIE